MKTFWYWLNESNAPIQINLQQLERKLQVAAEKVIDSMEDRQHKASVFDSTKFINTIQAKFGKYPLIANLMRALQSKNKDYIWDQYKKAYDWLSPQPYRETEELRSALRQIWTYLDHIESFAPNNEEIWDLVKKALEESQKNMMGIKSMIEDAISRIPNWSSPVTIVALDSQTEQGTSIEAAENAEIVLGSGDMSPAFTLFHIQGKTEIDDVLEGGDEDFFHNPQVQSDYFNLINEIRKPGSTGKGRTLILYTARPRKDREQLMQSNTLPLNIFLVNDYEHAEGLASDFGSRDIWKVRIDSKYLTQTLDGKIKYFQVTTNNAPAKLELIS